MIRQIMGTKHMIIAAMEPDMMQQQQLDTINRLMEPMTQHNMMPMHMLTTQRLDKNNIIRAMEIIQQPINRIITMQLREIKPMLMIQTLVNTHTTILNNQPHMNMIQVFTMLAMISLDYKLLLLEPTIQTLQLRFLHVQMLLQQTKLQLKSPINKQCHQLPIMIIANMENTITINKTTVLIRPQLTTMHQ